MDLKNDEIFSSNQIVESDEVFSSKEVFSIDPIQKFRGVRISALRKDLPAEVGIERNLIKVPICVANAKSANAKEFVYEFAERVIDGEKCIPKLIIQAGGSTLLPVPQHAKVLDILLAMLAHNFNENGEVFFCFKDISRLLGQSFHQNGMIKEAIKRYHYNSIFFQHCWVKDPGRFTSQGFLIIIQTDLYDGEVSTRNPRNSKKKENLHYVKFAPEVVESVKKNFIRLFPREAFSELDAGTYTLYKLFYSPTDREPIIRSLNYIANFIGWGNRIDRLRIWVVKHLEILQQKEFILWWRKKEDCFEVCSNAARFKRHVAELRRLNPMKADNTKQIAYRESRKKAKLVGEKIEKQTVEAVSKLTTKKKVAKSVTKLDLLHTEAVFEQLSKMTPEERGKFFASMKAIPSKDKDIFVSNKVAEFIEH